VTALKISKLVSLLTIVSIVAAFVGRIKPGYGFYSG
jgi:hypothetical protein